MGRTLQRYKKLFDQVKRDTPHRVYFLYGPEEFLKKEFLAELIKTRLAERNRAFNLDIFHADEFDRDSFADRVSSYPLFNDRRVVILKRFEALPVSSQDFVLERIANLAESVVLVVEASSTKLDTARLKRLEETADRTGLSFCFLHLSDEEAVERVKARLQREGFEIDPDALELLVNSVGTQLVDLANETEKIMLCSDRGSTITSDTVAAVVGRYRTESLFGFLDRLGKEDLAGALTRVHRIIDGGEEPVFVLAMLIRRIVQLLHVRLLMDEGGPNPKASGGRSEGSPSPFQMAILIEQAKYFTTPELAVYLENLRWADKMMKSSSVEPGHLIEAALVASARAKALMPLDP